MKIKATRCHQPLKKIRCCKVVSVRFGFSQDLSGGAKPIALSGVHGEVECAGGDLCFGEDLVASLLQQVGCQGGQDKYQDFRTFSEIYQIASNKNILLKVYVCCVFQPAFGCLQHPKAG